MPAQTKNKKGKLRRRAMRDVKYASQPELNELAKQRDQARDTFQESKQQTGNIYDALAEQLSGLTPQYESQAKQIASDLNTNLGGLSSYIGGQEASAAGGYLGTLGATGQGLLASDRMRNLGYQTSVQRQAALEETNVMRNLREDYDDIIQTIRDARAGIKGDWKQAFLVRLEELRRARKDSRLAQKELELRQKIAEDQLNFQKKTHRDDEKDEDRATEFFISEAERDLIQKKLRPLNQRLGNVKEEIRDTRRAYTPSERNRPGFQEEMQPLRQRKRRIQKKVRRKRRALKDRYGDKG